MNEHSRSPRPLVRIAFIGLSHYLSSPDTPPLPYYDLSIEGSILFRRRDQGEGPPEDNYSKRNATSPGMFMQGSLIAPARLSSSGRLLTNPTLDLPPASKAADVRSAVYGPISDGVFYNLDLRLSGGGQVD